MKIQGLTFILFLLICETVCGQVIVDTAFSYKVYYPIFKEKKPKVFIDGFHNNLHQKNTGFKPLSNLLQSFGFEVMPLNKSLDNEEVLANCDILVIANPIHQNNRGRWFNPTYNAFTKNEIQTINKWVKSGGRLLLIADHMPFAGAVNELSSSFGINYVNGFTGVLAP